MIINNVDDPRRIKFIDEKWLKGAEIYFIKARADPKTGQLPDILVGSNFRNTYSIVGFCGIDRHTPPFHYTITDGKMA